MTDAAHDARYEGDAVTLDQATDAVIETYKGDVMAAVRALIASNAALEQEVARLSGKVSSGYTRGRPKAR